MVLIAQAGGLLLAQSPAASSAAKEEAAKSQVNAQYGKLPLSFEANQGQADGRVRFTARGKGYSLFLADGEAVLALSKTDAAKAGKPGMARGAGAPVAAKTDVVRMQLAGARSGVQVSGADDLPGKVNYFIGNDPAKWRTDIPTYGKVRYKGVYDGVDLVYYGKQRQLEYDFVVTPGARPDAIGLRFDGVKRLKIDGKGNLVIAVKDGEIAFQKPVVYQERGGVREPVDGRFRLSANRTVGFAVGKYDRSRALVIDPVLVYSTFLGRYTTPNGIAVDSSGNAYVAGYTYSTDFPVTSGAFQTEIPTAVNYQSDGSASFVTKLNPSGTSLVYSTYLGGSGSPYNSNNAGDEITTIAVDASGHAYVAGTTYSSDFPVSSNAFQTTNRAVAANEAPTGFVTELNPTGSALVYSTYLGGSGYDWESTGEGDQVNGIALDGAGDAYVAGITSSNDFPVTSGAFQTTNNSGGFYYPVTGFITKLNPTGSAVVYSTYLGGSVLDGANAIAVDSDGHAYVTGSTQSNNFPTTAGAFQTTNKGDNAFVTKLNVSGSALIYSTFLGGSQRPNGGPGGAVALAIKLDTSGDAYVAGYSGSSNFPVTSGAFQTTNGSSRGGFVTELNPSGTSLIYSTFLGCTCNVNGIALDSSGNAYVAGTTTGSGLPVSSGAFQTTNKVSATPYETGFITKLNSTGTNLLYSTYFGGSTFDNINGIALDSAGDAYVAGWTQSSDFPTTSGAFQTSYEGSWMGFIAEFNLPATGSPLLSYTTLTSSQNPAPAGATVTFTATESGGGSTLPTGNVIFTVDGVTATETLNASGQATYSTSSLTIGTYTVTASYGGDTNFAASSGSLTQTIHQPTVATPSISPAGGRYPSSQTVKLMDSTPGATIYYTTDDSTPTTQSAPYPGPFVVSASETVKAIAAESGYFNSTVASATFSIGEPVSTPSILPGAGFYAAPQSVTITDLTSGAIIYYTTDGTLPTTQSNRYSESFRVASAETVKAIAIQAGYPNSAVASAAYTIGTAFSVSASSLAFGNQALNSESAAQTVTITNLTAAAIPFDDTRITGAQAGWFLSSNDCGASVAAGASCAIRVRFNPSGTGSATATLSIMTAYGSPQAISLSGTGVAPVFSISASSLDFGTEELNFQTDAQTVTVSNTGTLPLYIKGFRIICAQDTSFMFSTDCGATLAAGSSCGTRVRFDPLGPGLATATLIVGDNAAGSPQSVSLTGTGTTSPITTVSLSATSLDFGTEELHYATVAQTVTLTNTGAQPLTISAVHVGGAQYTSFEYSTNCGLNLAPAAACNIAVRFDPQLLGANSGAVTITDNATGSPQTVSLSGTGSGSPITTVSLSSTSVDFGTEQVNVPTAAQLVTLTNTGTQPLTIQSFRITGPQATSFEYSDNCTLNVAPGAFCTIRLRFDPVATGPAGATMSITDNAAGSAQTIGLSGTGQ
jgi:urease beta subunit